MLLVHGMVECGAILPAPHIVKLSLSQETETGVYSTANFSNFIRLDRMGEVSANFNDMTLALSTYYFSVDPDRVSDES
jgi:hypothetical protein